MCTRPAAPLRQAGVTLVETIVFIIVMSVGVVGVLSTMNASIRFSADPMVQKQLRTVAESLLAEVLHQPFTFCDIDDANASTATLSGTTPTCAVAGNDQNNGGAALTSIPTGTESRGGSGTAGFDNVADYAGFSQNPVTDVAGLALAGYAASVAVSRAGDTFTLGDNSAALQVTVTVTHGTDTFSLTGYRFRYAPRY